jgi:peptidoglycan hydrolase-like protein with peptidoglycan-binding domain
MALESARFRGDPVLERIANGDTSAFLRFSSTGPAVEKLQQALIDLDDPRFAIPDGATGNFRQQTSAAVIAYKTARGLTPNDPVAGRGTVMTLDGEWSMPFADHDEWFSWRARPIREFNFTRLDEHARRLAGRSFTLSPVSSWLPAEIRDTMFSGLAAMLDPGGSPLGRFAPPATWGVGPLDLYHCHIVVQQQFFKRETWDEAVVKSDRAGARVEELKARAEAAGERETPAWTAAYAVLLLNSGWTELVADALRTVLRIATESGVPVKLVWHTFEHDLWRPVDVATDNPRRAWWQDLAPLPGPLEQWPFAVGHGAMVSRVFGFIGLGLVVDKQGMVTVMGGSDIEADAVVGLPMARVKAARQGLPFP